MAKLAETVAGARVAGSRVLQASRKADPEGRMPVMGHLRELRNRIARAALAIGLGTVLGIVFFSDGGGPGKLPVNPAWRTGRNPETALDRARLKV
jgi:hypothetical protein